MPSILLVEDDPRDADLMTAAFERAGVPDAVVVAPTAEDGLSRLAARPRVALLDLYLPGFDGFEFLRRSKADPGLRSVPVVVLTGSAAEADRARAYSLGANAYLRKPFGFDALVGLARTVARFWTNNVTV